MSFVCCHYRVSIESCTDRWLERSRAIGAGTLEVSPETTAMGAGGQRSGGT
ncbi:hypothetical protein NJ7G_2760 [Natrinema sp. J7-2]|nr:hypothetical protein NJ7G_2760 [Natrinema sp. J7-2]